MAHRAERSGSDSRYLLRFAGTALALAGATLLLVLVVLPQRYILSAGFRESGLSFPDPGTPFATTPVLQVSARQLTARMMPTDTLVRGPAELFWARVMPLLRGMRYAEALPLFEEYLAAHPTDRDVRREYALTLVAAGRAAEALPVLTSLLEVDGDPAIRILLARTLRDLGRPEDASAHYEVLSRLDPNDLALTLEWARSFADAARYPRAEDVLRRALAREPLSVPLRVELARIDYYTNRLAAADQLLSSLPESDLIALGALSLRDDVRAALAVPPGPGGAAAPPPTLLEQAVAARERDDFVAAAPLFRASLEADPESVEAWLAYADFLQYEFVDFEGARDALLAVERLTAGGSADLQFRLAQLEVWTDRTGEAKARLTALLARLEDETFEPGSTRVRPADAHALLGDLYRWEGRRLAAIEQYELALAADPDNAGAQEGLDLIRAEVLGSMLGAERPRVGAIARALSDNDAFDRVDFGGEWFGLADPWVWGTSAGTRWVRGIDLLGSGSTRQGLYADLEGARWWRWGTIRTALYLGVQDLRPEGTDLALGASLRFADQAGGRTDLRFDHEPAHQQTNTLQSVLADVVQDRFSASHSRPLNDRWTLSTSAEVGSLDPVSVSGADRNLRLQGAVSVGRTFVPSLTLGVSASATRFTQAAPTPAGSRLYWDPNSAVSIGPYAQLTKPLSSYWTATALVNPGVARIDERAGTSSQVVPHVSAEAGLVRDNERYRGAFDVFYFQGQFDGYRAYGVRLSFSARGWYSGSGPR